MKKITGTGLACVTLGFFNLAVAYSPREDARSPQANSFSLSLNPLDPEYIRALERAHQDNIVRDLTRLFALPNFAQRVAKQPEILNETYLKKELECSQLHHLEVDTPYSGQNHPFAYIVSSVQRAPEFQTHVYILNRQTPRNRPKVQYFPWSNSAFEFIMQQIYTRNFEEQKTTKSCSCCICS